MAEQILVVRTADLKKYADFQGFLPMAPDEALRLYDKLDVLPMSRDDAEQNPTYKQLVAYTIVVRGGRYLTYLRGKQQGEARLRGNRSIGFGGHINSGDQANLFLRDHLKAAAFRELDEEIAVPADLELELVGLLNDDGNDVGRVHLGLVYRADLPARIEPGKREKSIARVQFAAPEELERDRGEFETWSRILIDNLGRL